MIVSGRGGRTSLFSKSATIDTDKITHSPMSPVTCYWFRDTVKLMLSITLWRTLKSWYAEDSVKPTGYGFAPSVSSRKTCAFMLLADYQQQSCCLGQ